MIQYVDMPKYGGMCVYNEVNSFNNKGSSRGNRKILNIHKETIYTINSHKRDIAVMNERRQT